MGIWGYHPKSVFGPPKIRRYECGSSEGMTGRLGYGRCICACVFIYPTWIRSQLSKSLPPIYIYIKNTSHLSRECNEFHMSNSSGLIAKIERGECNNWRVKNTTILTHLLTFKVSCYPSKFGDYIFSRKNEVSSLISWSFGWVRIEQALGRSGAWFF